MFVEAISEKAAVVNWVEDFLKNQAFSIKDEEYSSNIRVFTKKDDYFLPIFIITKDDFTIILTLSFMERDTSLIFNDYKIRRIKKDKEAPESYFESGDSDFKFRKLKEKINTLSKDLSKAVLMKKEDWKRKDVIISEQGIEK